MSNNLQSIPDVLKQTVQTYGTETAIHFMGSDTSFLEFDRASDQVAAGLFAQGVTKGDHVALYCVNSDTFAIAYFGIIKTGATVLPVNLLFKPGEIEYILDDASVTTLIYHEAFNNNVSIFRNNLSSLKSFIFIGEQASKASDTPWSTLLEADTEMPQPEINPVDDVACIL